MINPGHLQKRCSALFCALPKQARNLGTAYHGFSSALFCDYSLIPDPSGRSIMPRMSDSWTWLYALTGCCCPSSLVKVSCLVHDLGLSEWIPGLGLGRSHPLERVPVYLPL